MPPLYEETCQPPPDEIISPFAKPRSDTRSATSYSLLTWCPAAYRIRYRQGRELKWEKYSGEGAGGADLGSLVHWILSRWDFDCGNLDGILPDELGETDIERELTDIPPSLRTAFRSRSNRRHAKKWLASFAKSPECGELKKAHSSAALTRELSFSVEYGGVHLVGNIDVYWKDENGCHVRDWKITPEESAPHELYAAQLEFYAAACHAANPSSRVDAGLIYLRSEDKKVNDVREVRNWNELELKILTSAEGTRGPFVKSPEKCAICPFSLYCQGNELVSHTSPNVLK
jgi:hypothetical protein